MHDAAYSSPFRITSLIPVLSAMGVAGFLAALQPACGRSDLEITCVGHRYKIKPLQSGSLPATYGSEEEENEETYLFTPPSYIINDETHQAINEDINLALVASDRLRNILADATVELCRRTLKQHISSFDFRVDTNNCENYRPEHIISLEDLVEETVSDEDFDENGPTVVLNPACFGACLLQDCDTQDGTGDNFDDPPAHPFIRTVHCHCQIESIGDCVNEFEEADFPWALSDPGLTEDYCVPPAEELPADYCRTDIADYLEASIRLVNAHSRWPWQEPGSCGIFLPEDIDIDVTCFPDGIEDEDIVTKAIDAYTDQNDICAPGCSDFACDNFLIGDPPSMACSNVQGVATELELPGECDCDLLPEECFESAAIPGVCLPDQVGGGADGDGDDGGGDPDRLRSAINLLAGDWDNSELAVCAEIEPGGSYAPNPGNPKPSSAVSPYALTNGTSYYEGLQVTCPTPTTDDVGISTFDTTLEELCRLIPLCNGSSELELSITASEDETLLASGTLEKSGDAITTTEAGSPLTIGEHTIDLCVEHVASEVEACSAQSIRAAAPLGSGIDGFGYFAGELALDFVPLAGKPGAQELSLTDDGIAEVRLPSGFRFPFYGVYIDTIFVGTNGGISTVGRSIAAENTALPGASNADSPDIAVYWDDLDLSLGGGVYTWFDGTRFIVSWEDVHHACEEAETCDAASGIRVQAHIYASGRIELHYLDTEFRDWDYDSGESATIGISDTTWTEAVEVSYDSDALLGSFVTAIGFSLESNGCLADTVVAPPEVACAASDHFTTVCTSSGETVTLPLPYVGLCAFGSAGVVGEVIESGFDESSLVPLVTPILIDEYGDVALDEGVHRVRWWPADGEGDHVGPAFTQLVFVRTWVHDGCGADGRTLIVLTQGNDVYTAEEGPAALAVIGRYGDDQIITSEGADFIGDGPGDGNCETHQGDDLFVGEDGDDMLDAGHGDDHAWGGPGNDILDGADDSDMLDGQGGRDILYGGDDDDVLWGGLGDDVLEGGGGDDTLMPGSGIDLVYGDWGNDAIVILAACELTEGQLLSGGSGTDTLFLPPGLDIEDVENAGVTVDVDIESVQTSTDLPFHRAACEPS